MISRAARFGIAAAVLGLDRLTKHWIEQNVSAWDTHVIIPHVFNIIHAQNRGAAFGFLNGSDSPWRVVVVVGLSSVILCFVAWMLWKMPKGMWPVGNAAPIALSLIFGGAAGNLLDRIWRGSVTDFLQFFIGSYEWPSFNVADSAISTGAALLFLVLWRSQDTVAG